VIALLTAKDSAYIREAAKLGVFAYIVNVGAEELQSTIEITIQRFAEYHNLQGTLGRRAVIEQAKGILMARHNIRADKAFEMLRDESQHSGRKLFGPRRGGREQPDSAATACTVATGGQEPISLGIHV